MITLPVQNSPYTAVFWPICFRLRFHTLVLLWSIKCPLPSYTTKRGNCTAIFLDEAMEPITLRFTKLWEINQQIENGAPSKSCSIILRKRTSNLIRRIAWVISRAWTWFQLRSCEGEFRCDNHSHRYLHCFWKNIRGASTTDHLPFGKLDRCRAKIWLSESFAIPWKSPQE